MDAEDEEDARNRATEMGTVVDRIVPAPAEVPGAGATPESRPRAPGAAHFFLMAGAVICSLGCLWAVLKTWYGLSTLTRVAPLIDVVSVSPALLVVLILLDGFIWFVLCAALVILFVRVSRLE